MFMLDLKNSQRLVSFLHTFKFAFQFQMGFKSRSSEKTDFCVTRFGIESDISESGMGALMSCFALAFVSLTNSCVLQLHEFQRSPRIYDECWSPGQDLACKQLKILPKEFFSLAKALCFGRLRVHATWRKSSFSAV